MTEFFKNRFVCPSNHEFIANAKIRARCPECGLTAKRDFSIKPPEPTVEPKPEPIVEPAKEPVKQITLLRRGRPRIELVPKKATVAKPKLTVKKPPIGSKVSGGLVKTKRITTRGSMPTVKRAPKRTAIARHIQTPLEHGGSFLDHVMSKYGPG